MLPVIHAESADQVYRNVEIVAQAGCAGVFLVNHTINWRVLLALASHVRSRFPKLWLGVNCLDLEPEQVFERVDGNVGGIWVDNAEVDEQQAGQPAAERIAAARERSGWHGLYFGGVAFKYQREVTDLATAAATATHYMDVVTTSGPGTGQSASPKKIAALRGGLGDYPLAIASGITPENVTDYLGLANCFLVASSISRSFTELNPARLNELLQATARAGGHTEAVAQASHRHWPAPAARDAFLNQTFSFPNLAGRRILVVGTGGGCDIISAYALAQSLRPHQPALLIYANTKRHVELTLEAVTPHVFRVPPQRIELDREKSGEHGRTWIDQSMPRGDDGCPLVFRLPTTSAAKAEFIRGLQDRHQFDLVISVDTGADAIVCGTLGDPKGRDQEMLRILGDLGVEWYHLSVAPGCDGESHASDIREVMAGQKAAGHYAGCLPIDSLLPTFAEWSESLQSDRTPNVILNALADRLKGDNDSVIIPRGFRPAIPTAWLRKILVFRFHS